MGLFTDDPEVIALGGDYMHIACFSYIFSGFTFSVTYNSRAIIRLKVPTAINCVAILINITLNYCLIYGNFGMPDLGVKGAAINADSPCHRGGRNVHICIFFQRSSAGGKTKGIFIFREGYV